MRISLHRSRKQRPCESYRCDELINPGDLYVRHVAFPGDEGFEEGDRPWVMRECSACVDRHGGWVRSHYGVPAHLGGRVVFDGQPGVIVGLYAGQVHVRIDATRLVVNVHPMWRMEYLDGTVVTPEAPKPTRHVETLVPAGGAL